MKKRVICTSCAVDSLNENKNLFGQPWKHSSLNVLLFKFEDDSQLSWSNSRTLLSRKGTRFYALHAQCFWFFYMKILKLDIFNSLAFSKLKTKLTIKSRKFSELSAYVLVFTWAVYSRRDANYSFFLAVPVFD